MRPISRNAVRRVRALAKEPIPVVRAMNVAALTRDEALEILLSPPIGGGCADPAADDLISAEIRVALRGLARSK